VYGAHIEFTSYESRHTETTLRGIDGKLVEMSPVVVPQGLDDEGPFSDVVVPDYFPPGSIMVFETQMQGIDAGLEDFCMSGTEDAFADLDLVDLNIVLHRADGEESDLTTGKFGKYNVPGMGDLVYCGLEGFMNPLRHIMRYNDLGHPLAGHLREGTWAMDYVYTRLEK
jgi:glycogen debranching enzyme